jgi:glycosyltransferase involved in cell wall biosynthesis
MTVTGTDINQDLVDPVRRPLVQEVLDAVQTVVVFHEAIGQKIRREVPGVSRKIRVIGQAVLCDESRYDLRGATGLHAGDFVFFQPAGIRRVKNIPVVIPWLTRLQERYPDMKYILVGPVIEPEEAARVACMLRGLSWAIYPGALEHEQICAGLSTVQVVINSSLSEGGMSNAVLEAMSKGVPVLASDIEGNRSVITDGHDGFLFTSQAEFLAKAERLLDDPALRSLMGNRARMKIASQFRLEGEIDRYLALYRDVVAGRGGEVSWI